MALRYVEIHFDLHSKYFWSHLRTAVQKSSNDHLWIAITKIDKACFSIYGSSVNISLTPELDEAVKRKVASGLYNNASEVIREALRQSLLREQENEWLLREAAIGYAQAEAGAVHRVTTKKAFKELIRSRK